MKNSYPDGRLNAQKEYDQVARDYIHGFVGDKKLNDRYETLFGLEKERSGFHRGQVLHAANYKDFLIQRRKGSRKEQLDESRAQLQQRYNEEAALLSEARDPDARRRELSPDLCRYIAGINNRTAKWDQPLEDPFLLKKRLDEPQDESPRSRSIDIVQNPSAVSGRFSPVRNMQAVSAPSTPLDYSPPPRRRRPKPTGYSLYRLPAFA
ncbi:hypothetical protein GJ744_006331 [Endocarpon pusillum]|uniref:Uncharacterized protein n=1 Tax=Endocarpon pusillum TaxID=364733 RepID=A0A8H7ASS3_9EURO|nr:hypothetical protein GJ744_006331 [Endocarpon pusillum]